MATQLAVTDIDKLQQALQELTDNRAAFSTEAFDVLNGLLMERVRAMQAINHNDIRQTDEVRLVTVMFIDVRNSTELAQQMDTSDWKTVLGDAHRLMATVIDGWDGQIGQYLGDGLLAFFGAQRSGGDDALRAVSCALAAQAAINSYAADVLEAHGIEFSTRVGISTGRVVVGLIGSDSKQELLALGPATNLAARLQGLAPHNGIVVDATTHSRVRNQFVMQGQPPAILKGYKAPVPYYQVLERRVQRLTRFTDDTINGILVPLYGRDEAMQQIAQVLEQTHAQNGCHAITVTGDIGIGKSRLLQQTLEALVDDRFASVVMIAHYERRTRSHNLLNDVILNLCGIADDTTLEIAQAQILAHFGALLDEPDASAAAEIIGYLAGFGFEDSPHAQLMMRGGREHVAYPWVARWLRALAEDKVLLLVVDNLQWADHESIALLEYLVREAQRPALLLAAGRSAYRAEHQTYMEGYQHHTLITLEQLSPAATERLIRTVLGRVTRSPDWLAAAINERAEGNPLFVREFLGMLFDSEVFEPDEANEGYWRFNRINYDERELPNGLIGVLQARLDDLPPMARHIIQLAAVVGQSFWDSIVTELAGFDARPILETLVVRGMIVENLESVFENERQYTFRHTLYRDVAYEMLPRAMRESYHSTVARWLVMHIPGKPEYFPMLADQFHFGGEHEAALFTLLEAAQSRLLRGLLPETLLMTDKGRDVARYVAREKALPTVSQMWELRARAFVGLNRYDEATAESQSALSLLEELPPDQFITVRVQAARTMGIAYRSLGRYYEAFEAFSQAYDFMPEGRVDPPLLSSVLRAFGVLCLYQGKLGESQAYQERAYTYAQMTGQESDLTGAMTQLGTIMLERGHVAKALSYFKRLLEINRKRDFVHYQIEDMRNIGQVYLVLRNYHKALAIFDEALDLQQSIGTEDRLLQAYLGLCLLHLGRHDEGLPLLNDAVHQGEYDSYHNMLLELVYLQALALLHEYDRCRERAVAFIAQVENMNKIMMARGMLQLGLVEHALGGKGVDDLLHKALRLELEYGGREVWVIHAALARTSSDEWQARQHTLDAAKRLRAISSDLHPYPDLQIAFLANETVHDILQHANNK